MLAQAAIALAALLLAPTALLQDGPHGQIILDNASSSDADLYVDSLLACRAPAHGDCVTEVSSGIHTAMIAFDDGDFIMSDPVDVPADMAITLPVHDLMT